MKRKLFWFMAGLITAAAIVLSTVWINSRNQKNVSEEVQEEQVVITVTYAGGDDLWNQAVGRVSDAFMEQYPQYKVILQPATRTPGGFYDDYLRKQVAVGELGDVVELKNAYIVPDENLFVPLPGSLTGLVSGSWKAPDERVYILPLVQLEQGILYDKAVFDCLGLTPPGTWQDFEVLCGTLQENGYTPLVVGGGDSWHLMFWGKYFFNSCVTADAPSWQQECTLGTVHWMDEEPAKMLERYAGLFEKGYVNSDYAVTSDAMTGAYLADGRAVMLFGLCHQIAKVQELNPEMELGWFFMPDDTGQLYSFSDNKSGWAITADCKADTEKYRAAIRFLHFFYSEDIYAEVCSIMSALPVTRAEIPIENALLEEIYKQGQEGVLRPQNEIGNEDTPEGFEEFFYSGLMEVVDGSWTREQMLEACQSEWERLNGK